MGGSDKKGPDKKAPTPLIPLSGNYVTFPIGVDAGDITIVTWGQSDIKAANYYKLRAWFGKDDRSGPEPVFEPYGETIIFIAAEYLDPKYKGPVTGGKHILSMKDDLRDGWAMLKLDRRFEYGQDKPKDTTFRFIVYHPPIAREPPRVIFQHRFGYNLLVNVTDTAIKSGSASGDARVWALSTLLKGVAELVKAKAGDRLHQFESSPDTELAAQAVLAGKMIDYNVERRDVFTPQPIAAVVTKQDLEEIGEVFKSLGETLPPLKRKPNLRHEHLTPIEGRDPAGVPPKDFIIKPRKVAVQRRKDLGPENRVNNVYDAEGAKLPDEPKTEEQKQKLKQDLDIKAKDEAAKEAAKAAKDKETRNQLDQKGRNPSLIRGSGNLKGSVQGVPE